MTEDAAPVTEHEDAVTEDAAPVTEHVPSGTRAAPDDRPERGRDAGRGPEVLFVTKPLAAPWNDSGRNLPWWVASHLQTATAHVFSPDPASLPPASRVRAHRLRAARGGFGGARGSQLEIAAHLATGTPRADIWHTFFAPSPATVRAMRALRRLHPRVRVVQHINSLPAAPETLRGLLFGDRVVVLSRYAEALLADQPPGRVLRIPPCVPGPAAVSAAVTEDTRSSVLEQQSEVPLLVYAGDLEFSRAAFAVAEALSTIMAATNARVAFASRAKTPRAAAVEGAIRGLVSSRRVPPERVCFLGEVADMPDLLTRATLLLLPADTLFAKMDLPMVVLEAMARGVPAVIGAVPPLDELGPDQGCVPVDPRAPDALARTVIDLLGEGERRAALGHAGRAAWRARYAPQVVVPQIEAVYAQLWSTTPESRRAARRLGSMGCGRSPRWEAPRP